MTARSIRRAAEHKAKKLVRRDESNVGQVVNVQADCQSAASPAEQESGTISEAQLAANRQNALLSTGPTSEAGKAKSSLNAVKTGLTGRTVLLPADDAAEYKRHIAAYEDEFKPVGQRECDLVQSIADTQWRLLRIPSLESGIYALGHIEFANSVDEHEGVLRSGMIEVKTFLKYERQLRNLQLQESRLSRRREREIAELRELQQARQADEEKNVGQALSPVGSHSAVATANGFVFSTRDLNQAHVGQDACPAPDGHVRLHPDFQLDVLQHSIG